MKNFIEVHVITHENAPTTKVLINVSSIFIVFSLFNNAIIGIQMPSSNKKNGFEYINYNISESYEEVITLIKNALS